MLHEPELPRARDSRSPSRALHISDLHDTSTSMKRSTTNPAHSPRASPARAQANRSAGRAALTPAPPRPHAAQISALPLSTSPARPLIACLDGAQLWSHVSVQPDFTIPPPLAGEGGLRSRSDEGARWPGRRESWAAASKLIGLRAPSSGPSGHLLPRGEKGILARAFCTAACYKRQIEYRLRFGCSPRLVFGSSSEPTKIPADL